MVSNLKSETARANGAKSRGPTTAEGKEKSSRKCDQATAVHSPAVVHYPFLDCEDPAQFDETLDKLLGIHEPATPAENDIVEEMVAARWRIRRMWTIETGLLNAEILTQQSNPSVSEGEPGIHLAIAFRTLADDSRSLALASRYEARLQRLYDRAYKTLRELQQARKSEPPPEPPNIQIRWVTSQEQQEMRAAAAPPPGSTAPSVSEGESEEPNPAPETALPNEPTAAASKEDPVPQAFVPVSRNDDPANENSEHPCEARNPIGGASIRNPTSDIRNPTSDPTSDPLNPRIL